MYMSLAYKSGTWQC